MTIKYRVARPSSSRKLEDARLEVLIDDRWVPLRGLNVSNITVRGERVFVTIATTMVLKRPDGTHVYDETV